jgi:hypothetical protein
MPEITEFAVAANKSGLLEIVAIAKPGPDEALGVGGGPEVSSGGVWINQQLPHAAHIGHREWVDRWRSLGEPGSGNQRSGITIARNPDGRLEAAVLDTGMTVWHAWQKRPDGDWSSWNSLGNPGQGTISSPTLATDKDGRLELFTTSLLPELAVWHCRQMEPGQGPWEKWHSLGYPENADGSTHAPTLARNKDGRLELFIASGAEIWHCWQTAANSNDWSRWAPLGPGGHVEVGWPVAAREKDGRLEVLAAFGDDFGFRRQSEPGRGPWEPWAMSQVPHIIGMPELTIAAQADGRLVLFAFRRGLDSSRGVDLLRQTVHGEWLPVGSPIDTQPTGGPTFDDLTLAADGDGRLWLVSRIPGHTLMAFLNQTHPNGSEWAESVWNFYPPLYF